MEILNMTSSADQIIEWCEFEWDNWKADCSGFVKPVCRHTDVPLQGQANLMLDGLEKSSAWDWGAAPDAATTRAGSGCLVIGGLKQKSQGHVVIVVKSAPRNFPGAYWGRFGAVGRKNTEINWSWNRKDLPRIHYFSLKT